MAGQGAMAGTHYSNKADGDRHSRCNDQKCDDNRHDDDRGENDDDKTQPLQSLQRQTLQRRVTKAVGCHCCCLGKRLTNRSQQYIQPVELVQER